ncbi:metallophosphoesterase family protein [Azospira sp. I09]|uniref:metallophosphoesterase family protein n=1 Tax=Azospira sp. I09 TaxID=1765049 RepID=UPI001260C7F8|nr:metallophosphoesterase [Azospira sp. I09]BBN89714.1 hypothetical protein AZSP09_27370 [Azospira sp. I09]
MGCIFFCGDTHGNFEHVIQAVQEHQPAAVVFLGDLQPQQSLDKVLAPILGLAEIWWIPGNHDTDSQAEFDNLFGSQLAERNLHGRVVEIAGVRIAGLGGVFRGEAWYPPEVRYESYAALLGKYKKPLVRPHRLEWARKHRSTIFPEDYNRLLGQRADILVTHEAPACHPHGFEAIDELARSLRVATAFHGHHHDRLDYSGHHSRLGFQAFGVGFCGITDETGAMVLPGAFDERRMGRQVARGDCHGH